MIRPATLLTKSSRNQPVRTGKMVSKWHLFLPKESMSGVMMKLPIISAKPTMDAETYYNFTFNHTDVKKAKVCLSHHNAKIKIENLFSLRKNIPWIG